MKKVLIALDYNPSAQKIAEAGYALAKAMSAEITLLHVVSDPTYYCTATYSPIMGFSGYMETDIMQPDITDQLKEKSQDFLDKSKKHLGDDTIKTIVTEGDFADSIVTTAQKLYADIIIMGSHSRKWLEQIVMGSVTEEVLRQSSIPLYIIPTKEPQLKLSLKQHLMTSKV